MSGQVLQLEGTDGLVRVSGDEVEIERRGMFGGLKSRKIVPLSSVRHVRHERAGMIFVGYLYFLVDGEQDLPKNDLAAISESPYAVMFKRQQNDAAEQIARQVLHQIADRRPQPVKQPVEKQQAAEGRAGKGKDAALDTRTVFIALDTTGVGRDDRVIGFSGLESVGGKLTGREVRETFKTDVTSSDGAASIHGLTAELLSGSPEFKDKATEIAGFIKGAELVAFRANFVEQFLDREFKSAGLKVSVGSLCPRVRDVYDMANAVLPGKHHDLDALCRRFKVKVDVDGAGASPRKVREVALLYPMVRQKWLDAKSKDDDVMLCPACGDVEMEDCFFADDFELWCCEACGLVLKDYSDKQVALTPDNKVMTRRK